MCDGRGVSYVDYLGMIAVSSVVTATSSLIVGLALMADVILPDRAADISTFDEVYQMGRWGKDKNVSDQFFLDRISIVIYKYLNHKS